MKNKGLLPQEGDRSIVLINVIAHAGNGYLVCIHILLTVDALIFTIPTFIDVIAFEQDLSPTVENDDVIGFKSTRYHIKVFIL
jgi:hypothetical protein